MATFRVGVGSFNINDGSVGIGTEGSGHGNLKVEGTIKSTNLDVLGVSTFTRYSGFNADEVNVNNRDLTLSGEYSTTGDIVVEDGASLTVGLGSTACVGSVECISVKHHFSVPSGDTAQRNEVSGYGEGTVRYNSDLETLEFFNGNEWRQFNCISDIQNSSSTRGRGVFFGGEQKGGTNQAGFNDFVNIMSLGNSLAFGDLSTGNRSRLETAGASSTRGVFGCGKTPSNTDIIDYITIASEGKAIDFGNAKQSNTIQNGGTKSSSTRGIFGGGTPTELQYVEISTLANSLDFGDLEKSNGSQGSSSSSPTRAVFLADSGHTGGTIEAVTISSTGSAATFGRFIDSKSNASGAGNGVRGVFAGAYKPGDTKISLIEYANMSSLGNTTEFGDLSVNRACHRACSTNTRALFGGGYFTTSNTATGGTGDNRIEFVTIATTGNAQDFGDTTSGQDHARGASLSDSHGGLGGY